MFLKMLIYLLFWTAGHRNDGHYTNVFDNIGKTAIIIVIDQSWTYFFGLLASCLKTIHSSWGNRNYEYTSFVYNRGRISVSAWVHISIVQQSSWYSSSYILTAVSAIANSCRTQTHKEMNSQWTSFSMPLAIFVYTGFFCPSQQLPCVCIHYSNYIL